jgi:hypothetical protein
VSAEPGNSAALAGAGPPGSAVLGVLADGTPYFAPIGQIIADDSRVTCHLCGRQLRSVAAHLASHGWTKAQYCEAFGLERGQSLEGAETRKLRATAFSARLVFEPALRTGSARGRDRARTGELSRAAAAAARGRPFPQQRRQRSSSAVSGAAREQFAAASRQRAEQHRAAIADQIARERGYASIGEFVRVRLATGQSLASISRECGLHKDWMSRHLPSLDAAASSLGRSRRTVALDARWLPVIARLGHHDVAGYLRQRHLAEHASVNAIAREVGFSFQAVKSALQRHEVTVSAHVSRRFNAQRRADQVAALLGVESIEVFVSQARQLGWTWRQIAAESGQPETWLRRHSA